MSGVSGFSLSAFQIFLSSAKVKIRGLEVGQNPCTCVHMVAEQLYGKHEAITPDGNSDKHFEELFCVPSQSSYSCQGRERKLQMEIDNMGKWINFPREPLLTLYFKTHLMQHLVANSLPWSLGKALGRFHFQLVESDSCLFASSWCGEYITPRNSLRIGEHCELLVVCFSSMQWTCRDVLWGILPCRSFWNFLGEALLYISTGFQTNHHGTIWPKVRRKGGEFTFKFHAWFAWLTYDDYNACLKLTPPIFTVIFLIFIQ